MSKLDMLEQHIADENAEPETVEIAHVEEEA